MLARGGAQRAHAVQERRRQHESDQHPDRRVEAVHLLVHHVPVLRQLEARIRERPAPRQRAREGEPHERPELHLRDARRERDEGAHDGEETRPEDRLPPPAREPALGELELAERWFARWGRQTVFWARLLPVVRTFIALPAGIAQMELGPFVWLTFAGSLPWCWALAYAGFKLAENWNVVHEKMHGFDTAVGVLVALVLAAALLHRVRALRTAARQHPPAI